MCGIEVDYPKIPEHLEDKIVLQRYSSELQEFKYRYSGQLTIKQLEKYCRQSVSLGAELRLAEAGFVGGIDDPEWFLTTEQLKIYHEKVKKAREAERMHAMPKVKTCSSDMLEASEEQEMCKETLLVMNIKRLMKQVPYITGT